MKPILSFAAIICVILSLAVGGNSENNLQSADEFRGYIFELQEGVNRLLRDVEFLNKK